MLFKAAPEDFPSDECRDEVLEEIESILYFGEPDVREREILKSLKDYVTKHRRLSPKQRDLLASLREEHLPD